MKELLKPKPDWKPDRLGESAKYIVRRGIPIFERDSNGKEINQVKEVVDQTILFGKNSRDFDHNILGKDGKRFAKISNPWVETPENIEINKIHELIHPYAKKILEEIFPNKKFNNFDESVEYLVTEMNNLLFFDKNNLRFQSDDTDTCMKKIICTCISNAIAQTNFEFVEDSRKNITKILENSKFSYNDSKEDILGYDFCYLSKSNFEQKIHDNLAFVVDNFENIGFETFNGWTYHLPSSELISQSCSELRKMKSTTKILNYLVSDFKILSLGK